MADRKEQENLFSWDWMDDRWDACIPDGRHTQKDVYEGLAPPRRSVAYSRERQDWHERIT